MNAMTTNNQTMILTLITPDMARQGTPACAILRLMQDGENTSKTAARLKTFTAVVGGIEKFVKGEKADFLRVNKAAADRINEMRKTRGFYYFAR